jgi:hypothetical protein
MAITSASKTGYAICLILTILLVGLHLAGKPQLIHLSQKATSSPETGRTEIPANKSTSKR